MGRGLSDLQKWILKTIDKRELLNSDSVLIEFYGFEKRIHPRVYEYETTYYDWYKNGEKVMKAGIYNLATNPVSYSGDLEMGRTAFYHSVKRLIKRGLIKGSIRYGLDLTPSGIEELKKLSVNSKMRLTNRNLSIKDNLSLTDRILEHKKADS